MSVEAFERLHGALQYHIVNSMGWSGLRSTQADAVVPIAGMRGFAEKLSALYQTRGASPALIESHTWPTTGARRVATAGRAAAW